MTNIHVTEDDFRKVLSPADVPSKWGEDEIESWAYFWKNQFLDAGGFEMMIRIIDAFGSRIVADPDQDTWECYLDPEEFGSNYEHVIRITFYDSERRKTVIGSVNIGNRFHDVVRQENYYQNLITAPQLQEMRLFIRGLWMEFLLDDVMEVIIKKEQYERHQKWIEARTSAHRKYMIGRSI